MDPAVLHPDDSKEFPTEERCHILESSNTEGDEALSIARARVPVGVTTMWHAVDGADERYLIVKGTGRVSIGDESARLCDDVGPGDIVLIPSGTPQRIANTGECCLEFYALCTPRFREEMYRSLE